MCDALRRYAALKSQGLKEERVLLLEAWRDAEAKAFAEASSAAEAGGLPAPSREHLAAVEAKFPRKIKMKRPVAREDEEDGETVFEEYFDYAFPDDEKKIGAQQRCFKAVCIVHH